MSLLAEIVRLRLFGSETTRLLRHIHKDIKHIMLNQAQLAEKLRALKTQNDKASVEQKAAMAKLQTALDNAGITTPEVDEALDALSASIQRDDDENADEESPAAGDSPADEPTPDAPVTG